MSKIGIIGASSFLGQYMTDYLMAMLYPVALVGMKGDG